MDLTHLPLQIIFKIVKCLSFHQILNLSLSCKELNLVDQDAFWMMYYHFKLKDFCPLKQSGNWKETFQNLYNVKCIYDNTIQKMEKFQEKLKIKKQIISEICQIRIAQSHQVLEKIQETIDQSQEQLTKSRKNLDNYRSGL